MPNRKLKLGKYLRKNAALRPVMGSPRKRPGLRHAVIIPALAEFEFLPPTLDSLAANPDRALADTLVMVVVNQPENPMDAQTKGVNGECGTGAENNLETLRWLEQHRAHYPFALAWIDAASPSRQLRGKGGVGMARRTGGDSLLHMLYAAGTASNAAVSPERFIFMHLDADTTVAPDYLETAPEKLITAGTDGGVVDYQHQRPAHEPEVCAAIDAYEQYLRYVVAGLKMAGSPYAFHTIGSTMLSTAAGYVKAGGVPPKRQAGEDFYFLQQLAKNGGVCEITDTRVFPSARLSARNPYGTGPALQSIMREGIENYKVFSPECFRRLRDWLDAVRERPTAVAAEILAGIPCPHTRAFVEKKGFAEAWHGICRQHQDTQRRIRAFHEWFDALATIRLIRHLSRSAYPPVTLAEATGTLVLNT